MTSPAKRMRDSRKRAVKLENQRKAASEQKQSKSTGKSADKLYTAYKTCFNASKELEKRLGRQWLMDRGLATTTATNLLTHNEAVHEVARRNDLPYKAYTFTEVEALKQVFPYAIGMLPWFGESIYYNRVEKPFKGYPKYAPATSLSEFAKDCTQNKFNEDKRTEALRIINSMTINTLKSDEQGPIRKHFRTGYDLSDLETSLKLRKHIVSITRKVSEASGLGDVWVKVEAMQKIGQCRGGDPHKYVDSILANYLPDFDLTGSEELLNEEFDRLVSELIDINGGPIQPFSILPEGYRLDSPFAAFELSDDQVKSLIPTIVGELSGVSEELLESSIGQCTLDKFKGYPAFTTDLKEDLDKWRSYIALAYAIRNGIADDDLPLVVGERRQTGKIDVDETGTLSLQNKRRVVYMGSLGESLSGNCFFKAVLPILKQHDVFAAYSGQHVLGPMFRDKIDNMIEEIEEIKVQGGKVQWICAGLDPTHFDQNAGPILKRDGIWNSMKRLCPAMSAYFDWARRWYVNAPVIIPGRVIKGEHGLLSGMLLTSFIGSLYNAAVTRTVCRLHGINIRAHAHMGDDTFLVGFRRLDNGAKEIGLSDLVATYSQYTVNIPDDVIKNAFFSGTGEISTDVAIPFMGRYWRHNPGHSDDMVNGGVFSLTRALTHLLYPENLSEEEKLIVGRKLDLWSTIYEDSERETSLHNRIVIKHLSTLMNVEGHPAMREFIQYVMEISPLHLSPLLGWIDFGKAKDLIKKAGAHIDYSLLDANGLESNKVVGEIVRHYQEFYVELHAHDEVIRSLPVVDWAELLEQWVKEEEEAKKKGKDLNDNSVGKLSPDMEKLNDEIEELKRMDSISGSVFNSFMRNIRD